MLGVLLPVRGHPNAETCTPCPHFFQVLRLCRAPLPCHDDLQRSRQIGNATLFELAKAADRLVNLQHSKQIENATLFELIKAADRLDRGLVCQPSRISSDTFTNYEDKIANSSTQPT